ncbi:MAG: flagellar basal body protein [Bryobacteraceae bacterium]
MDLVTSRQQLVASNIANADTPGYKTKDIDFQAELQSLTADSAPRAVEVDGLQVKNDGNNVSLDREARLLAENTLRFTVAINLARAEVKSVKSAIQEGQS